MVKSDLQAPRRKKVNWYEKNKERIFDLCRFENRSARCVIKGIISNLSEKYDLDEAKRIYEENTDRELKYTLDLLDLFPEMEKSADAILWNLGEDFRKYLSEGDKEGSR